MAGIKQTNGISALPNTCWPIVRGGPTSFVIVAGVHIYVGANTPAGLIETHKEGPSPLTQGVTARIRPPNENPNAETDNGATNPMARKTANKIVPSERIYTVYFR